MVDLMEKTNTVRIKFPDEWLENVDNPVSLIKDLKLNKGVANRFSQSIRPKGRGIYPERLN
jgi:hypothetical protein